MCNLKPIIVVTTTASKEEATKIVKILLKEKLVACANIFGPVASYFWWQGKIEEAQEFMVFMKTNEDLFERLSERIKMIHSYEVPELLALPITKGFPPYLDWLKSSLSSEG